MAQITAAAVCPDPNSEAIEPMLPPLNRILVVSDESRRSANREPSSFPMSLMGRTKKRHRNPNDQNRLVRRNLENLTQVVVEDDKGQRIGRN